MSERSKCEVCEVGFSLFKPGRRCSQCDRRCCDRCIHSNYLSHGTEDEEWQFGKCVECVLGEVQGYSMAFQDDLSAREEINRELKNELKQQLFAMEKFRGFMQEFCETFGTETAEADGQEAVAVDSTIPIAKLVDRCQGSLQSVRNRIQNMQAACDQAAESESRYKEMLESMTKKLQSMSQERDDLRLAMKKMNEALCKMELEVEQLGDIKRECADLRERCKRMEEQREDASGRFSSTSIWDRMDAQRAPPSRSYLLSVCCPRFWR